MESAANLSHFEKGKKSYYLCPLCLVKGNTRHFINNCKLTEEKRKTLIK